MKPFAGFPKAKDLYVLPQAFFEQLLPQVDDLAELKVLLHILALLQKQKGWPRCVSVPFERRSMSQRSATTSRRSSSSQG